MLSIKISDLSEEFKILQGKYDQSDAEKESLKNKQVDQLYKMQQMNEKVTDLEERNEQLVQKLEIIEQENGKLNEAYERAIQKVQKIEENNILIPKDGKHKAEEKGEADDFGKHLQEEVRKLHLQLRHKETIIEKLKGSFEDPTAANAILEKEEELERPDKEYEAEILKVLLSTNLEEIPDEQFIAER